MTYEEIAIWVDTKARWIIFTVCEQNVHTKSAQKQYLKQNCPLECCTNQTVWILIFLFFWFFEWNDIQVQYGFYSCPSISTHTSITILYTLHCKFPFMNFQKCICYFQIRVMMFCLLVSTFIYQWEIYIFPGSVWLFCLRKRCGLILGIYK